MNYILIALFYFLIIVYFLFPPASTVWLIVSLVRWIKTRHSKKQLVMSAVTTGIAWACFVGLTVLFMLSIKYM